MTTTTLKIWTISSAPPTRIVWRRNWSSRWLRRREGTSDRWPPWTNWRYLKNQPLATLAATPLLDAGHPHQNASQYSESLALTQNFSPMHHPPSV
ncbi:ORF121 [White spot syndrome virus]|uniref:ORF121 n=1 Tax=White spot syndrome virus TaxID=342409 RepID=A0A2D3I5N5_9VIRU|nr:ORF121 [White spot syndrome virus]